MHSFGAIMFQARPALRFFSATLSYNLITLQPPLQSFTPSTSMRTLLLVLLAHLSLCLLKITSPVIPELSNNQITYSLANFGEIHYGTTLKGTLSTSTQSNDLCNPISPLKDSNTILLAQRGECSFVKKVLNGQKAGAKMVVISDNIVEDSAHITMADDGNGRLVHIPSIFINEKTGQILESQLHRSQVELSIRFDVNQTDKVNLTLYLNINDRHSAVLVRQLQPSIKLLQDYLTFNISYYSQPCAACSLVDCYGSKEYCIISSGQPIGSLLIDAELIQYGVFLDSVDKWLQLADSFDNQCPYSNDYIGCLQTKMGEVKAKQKEGYESANLTKLLDEWQQDALVSGIFSYPAAKVNGVKYLGNVDSEDVIEMVCASLKNPPVTGCGEYDYLNILTSRQNDTESILWGILISLTVVSLIILGVWIYKKTVKKEITNEMSLKVTEMVTQYIKLASDQERKAKNREIEISREDL